MPGQGQFLSRVPAGQDWAAFLPGGLANRVCDLFTYGTDFLPIGATTTLTNNIQIQNDSDFVVLAMNAIVTDTADTTFLVYPGWPFTVQLNDAGAGRQQQNQAVHLANQFWPKQFPLRVEQPKFLRAGSTFSVTLTNLSAVARNVRLSFTGAKVFGY